MTRPLRPERSAARRKTCENMRVHMVRKHASRNPSLTLTAPSERCLRPGRWSPTIQTTAFWSTRTQPPSLGGSRGCRRGVTNTRHMRASLKRNRLECRGGSFSRWGRRQCKEGFMAQRRRDG